MFDRARKIFRDLISNASGNAALIVAISMPAVIGGGGLAVDTAQWFLWKRELQVAVDQAALAGAWARTSSSTISTYETRAIQEYNANIQTVGDFDSTPTVTLGNHGSGLNNAVTVEATASKALPFSSFLTGRAITVKVSAKAATSAGTNYSGCIIALHPSMQGAFTLGGNASGSATCGVVALSTHPTAAMVKNGSSTAQLGMLVAGGGIDSSFSSNGTMHPNSGGLTNPLGSIAQPNPSSSPARTYSCPATSSASTSTTATKRVSTVTTYEYHTGNNSNQALASANAGTDYTTYSPATAGSSDPGTPVNNSEVPANTVEGSTSVTSYSYMRQVSTSPKKYEVKKIVTTTTYTNVTTTTTPGSDGIARPLPGTYSTISIACETHFQPGIYVVDSIDFGQNKVVTGTDVLFVIKTSNGMHINSNSDVTLSGITKDTLMNTYGYTSTVADQLASLVFHDQDSTEQIKLNGNSDVVLNGIVYTPKREIWFNGTTSVSGVCMMVVANNVTITGATDFNNFCIPAGANILDAGGAESVVTLVS
ncbi:MAG: pilus assembly protein TadG-related protein [Novosphingobium sp.]